MSGINPDIFTAVCRLRIFLIDDIGNSKEIYGTGFWVKTDSDIFFVTNKHNLDPTLKLGKETRFKLDKVYLQLRRMVGANLFPETNFFIVNNLEKSVTCHPSADVAVITNPEIDSGNFGYNWFNKNEIADSAYLSKQVLPMDIASFIGFPGNTGRPWWDELWQIGIARVVNIASNPSIPFTNTGIRTANVTLVSGLSFSGSSGSPIILHQKGFKAAPPIEVSGYVQPKLIGIMSGHWWNEEEKSDLFFHSGLSYFTRSTSILELI
jgi:hypothetical protein